MKGITLYLNGRKADIDRATRFPLNFAFSNLTNPAAVRFSFSKTVSLPSTDENDNIFNFIYRPDHIISNFDPSKRVPFVLTHNNTVLESGYFKLNSIDYSGQYPNRYNITLYGGIGEFYYSLSEKNMDELNVNPDNYSHTINKEAVQNSWVNDYYRYFITYSGQYSNFDSDKVFTSFTNTGNEIIDIVAGGQNMVGITKTGLVVTSEDTGEFVTYDDFDTLPRSFSSLAGIRYDEFRDMFIIFDGRNVYYSTSPTNDSWTSFVLRTLTSNDITGIIISDDIMDVHVVSGQGSFGSIAFILVNGWYIYNSSIENCRDFGSNSGRNIADGFTTTTPYTKPSLARWRNSPSQTIYGVIASDNAVYYIRQTASNVINYKQTSSLLDGILPTSATCSKDSSGPNSFFITSTTNTFFANKVTTTATQLTWGTVMGNGLFGSNTIGTNVYTYGVNGSIYSINEFGSIFPVANNLTSYNIYKIVYTNGYYYALLRDSSGRTVIGISTNVSTWTVYTGLYNALDVEDLNEHERNEFRASYQRPGLRLKHLFTQILEDSGYTYDLDPSFFSSSNPYWEYTWCIMDRLRWIGDEPPLNHAGNIRTGDQIAFANMMKANVTQLSFFNNFCKCFGLIVRKDKLENHLTIQTRQTFFADRKILDWTDKLDMSKVNTIKPLTFDYKYAVLRWKDAGSHYEEQYRENYNRDYGYTRKDTGWEFDDNEKDLIENNLFSNTVVSREYSRYFEGRYPSDTYADDKVIPALYTLSNDRMDYNESSFHLVFSTGTINTGTPIRITDDNRDMLNLGLFMWNDNPDDTISVSVIPRASRFMVVNALPTVYYSLDFGKPAKRYYVDSNPYPENSTLYSRFWQDYIEERFNPNNKVRTFYFNLSPLDINQFDFNTFIVYNNTLWHVNQIIDYDAASEGTTKVEAVGVYDITKYR